MRANSLPASAATNVALSMPLIWALIWASFTASALRSMPMSSAPLALAATMPMVPVPQ